MRLQNKQPIKEQDRIQILIIRKTKKVKITKAMISKMA